MAAGQRQAIEIQIKWREVLAQKQNMLNILSRTTGHSPEKLDKARRGAGAAGMRRGAAAKQAVLQVWQGWQAVVCARTAALSALLQCTHGGSCCTAVSHRVSTPASAPPPR